MKEREEKEKLVEKVLERSRKKALASF